MSNWSVYIHTTPDGKVYVGATSKPPEMRWNYGCGYKRSLFSEAIERHGWSNIEHKIVKSGLTKDEAYSLERELISQYDSTNPIRGYNRSTGGHGSSGVTISDETRSRMVKSHTGKKLGPHSPEWNQKISEGNKGKKKPHIGVPRSEECIRKIRMVHMKPVLQYSQQMVLVKEYPSIRDAARDTGIKNQNISACCLGKAKTAGGYIWKHKNNMEVH